MLRKIAEENVVRVRGSDDVPGFEACVEEEMANLRKEFYNETAEEGKTEETADQAQVSA